MTFEPETESFRPRRGLRNAHAQTLAGNFLPRKNLLPPAEDRLFSVEDDVQVLCHCHWQPEDIKHQAPTVVIVHGLEGSSSSQYVIGVGSKAWAQGMNVVRMNMRNCGGTERLAPTLYHSGLSADVGAVVRTLIADEGLARIGLVGYSMGGNLVLKLAGEWSSQPPVEVKAICAVSPATDLGISADALHAPVNRIYEWKFLFGLRQRYRRKLELYPDRYDRARLHRQNFRSIRQFDDQITAPYSGFDGADDYYTRASSGRVVDRIDVPTLVIHSTDDPFIKMSPETRSKLMANANVHFIETQHGGHCAFVADANGYDGRWAEMMCIDFIQKSC
jgi:predicted alpha/beta-fold hydrolase